MVSNLEVCLNGLQGAIHMIMSHDIPDCVDVSLLGLNISVDLFKTKEKS